LKFIFLTIITLLISLMTTFTDAKPALKVNKFKNPAIQFQGMWRVDGYDTREFEKIPKDLEEQLDADRSITTLTLGVVVELVHTGRDVMPGTINPQTMTSPGPEGETLRLTIKRPFSTQLCAREFWTIYCKYPKEDYLYEFIITEITKWTSGELKRNSKLWSDIRPITYTFVGLDRRTVFEAWVAKSGDIIFPVSINVPDKKSQTSKILGIRLKKI
jgi:hypothetical protein